MHEPTVRLDNPDDEPLPHAPPPFLEGWSRYVVVRRIGSGGMGEVFKAWDPQLGRNVALKFLYNIDTETLDRFQRESRSQAKVDHPAICKVYEVGEVHGHPYIAMQEIDGVTLDEAARGLTVEQKVRLVREIADAIHAAHRLGLVHRDLKPGNILVEKHDDELRPYVVDFGLARDQASPSGYTLSGSVFGTIGYMSPEQARGATEPIDRRTDVYNLGVILFELLSGKLPIDFTNVADAVMRLQTEDARRLRKVAPSVPRDLETIVMKCLERDRQRRYDSARAVVEELTRFLDGEPITARPASLAYRVTKRIVKHRAVAIVVAIALVLLAITGGSALWSRWNADRRAALAQQFGQQIKEMELVTRMAHMLPPERTTPARRLLAPRMDRIRREMEQLGATARGPGHYALARASLALGDFDRAQEMIDRAAKAGYDTPEVRYTRGELLGHFYEDALSRAASIADKDLRASAIEAAEKRFRDAALVELRGARGASIDNPAMLEAKLAFLEKKWDQAVAAARRASATAPWLYESKILEASILRVRSRFDSDAGDVASAMKRIDEAGEVMRGVLDVARSDALAYVEECQRRQTRIGLIKNERWMTQQDVVEATEPCKRALTLDPALMQAWRTIAVAHANMAEDLGRRSEDPRANVEPVLVAASRAADLGAKNWEIEQSVGIAHLAVARWQFNRGEDPRVALDQAAAALRRAMTLEQREPRIYNSMANTLLIRSFYEGRIGADPTKSIEGAIDNLRRALELSPRFVVAVTNISNAYVQLSDLALRHGKSPRAPAEQAIAYANRAVTMQPTSVSTNNNRGNAFLAHAEAVAFEGGDPARDVAEAIASSEKAIALRPDYALSQFNIAYGSMLVARYRAGRGEDPSAPLAKGREWLTKYNVLSPDDPDAAMLAARLHLAEAEWLARRGGNAKAAAARGLEALKKAQGPELESVAAKLRAISSSDPR